MYSVRFFNTEIFIIANAESRKISLIIEVTRCANVKIFPFPLNGTVVISDICRSAPRAACYIIGDGG